jgi:hypothetical protein
MSKGLQAQSWEKIPTMGTNATLRTVSASTMITDWESGPQGQMSHGDVEKGDEFEMHPRVVVRGLPGSEMRGCYGTKFLRASTTA